MLKIAALMTLQETHVLIYTLAQHSPHSLAETIDISDDNFLCLYDSALQLANKQQRLKTHQKCNLKLSFEYDIFLYIIQFLTTNLISNFKLVGK